MRQNSQKQEKIDCEMDTFKIVAVIKKRSNRTVVEYCYVPHKWEKNNRLFWPRNNLSQLREDASSSPEENWLQYKCKVKKDKIVGLEEAELWEEEYVGAETENEEHLSISHKLLQKTVLEVDTSNNNSQETQLEQLFAIIDKEQPDEQMNPQQSSTVVEVVEFNNNMTKLDSEKLDEIIQNQLKIIENQNRIQQELQSGLLMLRLTTDALHKNVKDLQIQFKSDKLPDVENQENEGLLNKFYFPLNTVEDVLKFDKEICQNNEYKNYLVKTYNNIGGTEGKEEGKPVARKLLSIIFTKHVLTLFSWTGISRTRGIEKKKPFQSCTGILSFFFEVISLADSRWTQQKNELFFKAHTLKHAKQSNEAFQRRSQKTQGNENIQERNIPQQVEEEGTVEEERTAEEAIADEMGVDQTSEADSDV